MDALDPEMHPETQIIAIKKRILGPEQPDFSGDSYMKAKKRMLKGLAAGPGGAPGASVGLVAVKEVPGGAPGASRGAEEPYRASKSGSKRPQGFHVGGSGLTDAEGNAFAVVHEQDTSDGGSDFRQRTLYVGDTLPQGNITAISDEGIMVIPDEGEEYLIPLGSGPRRAYQAASDEDDDEGEGAREFGGDDGDASGDSDLTPDERRAQIREIIDAMGERDTREVEAGRPDDEEVVSRNSEIYPPGTPEAQQDMARADLNVRINDPDMGTLSHTEHQDGDATYHTLHGRDGIIRTFTETADGATYNTTKDQKKHEPEGIFEPMDTSPRERLTPPRGL